MTTNNITKYQFKVASFREGIQEVDNYVTSNIRPAIENLRLNKIFMSCTTITPSDNSVELKEKIQNPPDMFVVANKLKIVYTKQEAIEQIEVSNYKLNPRFMIDKITFDGLPQENIEIPVCILISDNLGSAKQG